jgi:hypothetical protein
VQLAQLAELQLLGLQVEQRAVWQLLIVQAHSLEQLVE